MAFIKKTIDLNDAGVGRFLPCLEFDIVDHGSIAYPPSWRWRIVRRDKLMGVLIEGGGFSNMTRPGGLALADFLGQLELENFRIDEDIRQSAQLRGATCAWSR